MVTFRLEWTEDMRCAHHRHDSAQRNMRSKPLPKKRASKPRIAFTPEEEGFLKELKEQKEQKLKWNEIHQKFKSRFPFPERSVGCLQVRYCTKLKRRADEED